MEISNYTSYFLEAKQPTQPTTIENLQYENILDLDRFRTQNFKQYPWN